MISGRSFAELCRWVFDPRYPGLPRYMSAKARNGERVFINGDFVHEFVKCIPKLYFKKHVFVVHNSDEPFDQAKLNALLPYTDRIYAINTSVSHPLLTTIPLGFADRQVEWATNHVDPCLPREIYAYANFMPHTNQVKRNECLNAIRNDARVTLRSGLTDEEYRKDLCRSTFVLCPEGTGMDTHRFYEALLCGATPVVLRNALTPFYSQFPVCVVDSWSDMYTKAPSNPLHFQAKYYIR